MRLPFGPIIVALVLVGALGAVHGIYTDRWGPSDELEKALEGMSRVPQQFGDWRGEDETYDPEMLTRAGVKAGVFRHYSNTRSGENVSFLLVCGRGGPVTVHTPDICYAGAGYKQIENEQQKEVRIDGGPPDLFKTTRFTKAGAVVPTNLEIYWTWSRDGIQWQAPTNPRLSLARSAALYKLYVVREYAPKSRAESADTCESFLRQAIPAIRQTLPASVGRS